MQIHSSIESPSCLIAAGACAPRPRARPAVRMSRAWVWVVAVSAVLVAAFGLGQAGLGDSALARDLMAFQHRVTGDVGDSTVASPVTVLAQRYVGTLQPEVRQRISDQVRSEQRAGVTAQGNDAFVMRRLELYEAAFQQSRSVAASQAM